MLKPSFQLKDMQYDYLQTKLQTYLQRPTALHSLTYPEFYRWWRPATTAEQRKASEEESSCAGTKGGDDFGQFLSAKTVQGLSKAVIAAVERHYNMQCVESLPASLHWCPPRASQGVADAFMESIDFDNSNLMNGLSTHHWLIESKIRNELISVLSKFKPGSVSRSYLVQKS